MVSTFGLAPPEGLSDTVLECVPPWPFLNLRYKALAVAPASVLCFRYGPRAAALSNSHPSTTSHRRSNSCSHRAVPSDRLLTRNVCMPFEWGPPEVLTRKGAFRMNGTSVAYGVGMLRWGIGGLTVSPFQESKFRVMLWSASECLEALHHAQ